MSPADESHGGVRGPAVATALGWRLALAFGIIVSGWSLFWIRDGPTVPSGDSVAYLESARCLLESQQHGWLIWQVTEDGGAAPLPGRFEVNTIWPPGLSALLAAVMWLGVDIQWAVRGLVALFAGLAAMGGFAVARLITGSLAAASILTALYFGLFAVQWWVVESWMAEGIYLAVTFGGILLFHRVASAPRASSAVFLPVGLLFSTVYYLKSIGPSFMLAAVATVFCLRTWDWRRRLISAIWLAMGCGSGAAPWLLRNLALGTIGSGGQAVAHPIIQSSLDLGRLFVPRHGAFAESQVAIVMLGMFGMAVIGLLGALLLPAGRMERVGRIVAQIQSAGPGAMFALVYLGVFMAAVAAGVKMEKTGWVETRYWMEIGLFLLIFGWLAAAVGLAELRGLARQVLCGSVALVGIVIATSNVSESVRTASFARVRIPDELKRKQARTELIQLLRPTGPVAFVSNERYRFGIETGLTASETLAEGLRRVSEPMAQVVYVGYPRPTGPTMSLVTPPLSVSATWPIVGTVGSAKIYLVGGHGTANP